ncbi:MAG: hypothetical protein ACRDI3_02205 [Actinomycetota bacterium]
MKIFRVVVALIALGVVAAVVIVPLTASAQQTLRFHIAFRASEFHEVDANDDGDQDDAGDAEVGNFVLKRGGEKEGHMNFHCISAGAHPPRDLCWATAQITGKGTITLHGLGPAEANKFLGAITGGTGAYRGATGVFKLDFGRRSTATFEID